MLQKTKYKFEGSLPEKPGAYFNFAFALGHAPDDKGKVEAALGFHTCREGLVGNMRDSIMGNSSTAIKTDKMRMLFRWTLGKNRTHDEAEHREWLNRGLSVLHAYERFAGWPLTKVYSLDCGKKFDYVKTYYFLSSRRWIKASYLVSLYILMVRLGRNSDLSGFKGAAGFEKLANGLMNKYTAANGGWNKLPASFNSDVGWLRLTLPYWGVVLKGYPEMFRKMKVTHYWSHDRINDSGGASEGIAYLCDGSTNYKTARKKLLELSKKSKK